MGLVVYEWLATSISGKFILFVLAVGFAIYMKLL